MIPRTATRWQTADWQLLLKSSLRSVEALCDFVKIDVNEVEQRHLAHKDFPVRVPTPFAALMEEGNSQDPLLLQVLPQAAEMLDSPGFVKDPLQEADFNTVPGLIHKYHGRVLLITSPNCAINCRYCFRRHFPYQDNTPGLAHWQQALDYIANNSSIEEVILSGGDPLSASDSYLQTLIERISAIRHVRWLRIHTRLPVVLPQRITSDLLQLLTATRLQVSMVLHINHANEIGEDLQHAVQALHNYGIRLLNQTVLLKDINDTVKTQVDLLAALHQQRIQAYYLHLLDPVKGAAHFLVSDEEAMRLYEQLRRQLPGFMLPKLVRELAHAPYKTSLEDQARLKIATNS